MRSLPRLTAATIFVTQRLMRFARHFGRGALLGLAYFVADALGTFAAIGDLFHVSPGSFVLLAIAAATTAVLGGFAGLVGGAVLRLLPPRDWSAYRSRLRAATLGAALVVALAGYGFRTGRNAPDLGPRPDVTAKNPEPVLWIVVDTLRADTFYGDSTTFPHAPNTQEFASKSHVFLDAESSAGWTIPSTAAFLTGIHSSTMDASAGRLPDWAPTIATRLRHAGYETRAVVDNVIIEARNGFAQGFESYEQSSGFRFAFTFPAFRLLPTNLRDYLRGAIPASYAGAPTVTERAIERINERTHDALFLYVHYMDPHGPYYPHEGNEAPPPGAEPLGHSEFARMRDSLREALRPEPPGEYLSPSQGQLTWLKHHYAGEIRYADAHLGRLLARWRAEFGDRGMVIITSDHGEQFLEHGFLSHGATLHRELMRVPLIVHVPGTGSGTVSEPVSQLDLVPTTLDFLGVALRIGPGQDAPPLPGRSWLPSLRSKEPLAPRPLISSHARYGRRMYRYREGAKTYIKSMYFDGRPTLLQLYDLEDDPAEQNNRIDDASEEFDEFSSRFETLADALMSREPPSEDPSEADQESLKALGYIR